MFKEITIYYFNSNLLIKVFLDNFTFSDLYNLFFSYNKLLEFQIFVKIASYNKFFKDNFLYPKIGVVILVLKLCTYKQNYNYNFSKLNQKNYVFRLSLII